MTFKKSPINIIWVAMILCAVAVAPWGGKMEAVSMAGFDSAVEAVKLVFKILGPMALWLGMIKILEEAGAMKFVARAIQPVMKKLFNDVPTDHPAMGAMILNISANALGLGNAATPMGIKAMQELEKISPVKGTASDSMCLFLAINTSAVTILPLGAITLRAIAGASNPAAVLIPTLGATIVSTLTAIIVAKTFSKKDPMLSVNVDVEIPIKSAEEEESEKKDKANSSPNKYGKLFVLVLILVFFAGTYYSFAGQAGKNEGVVEIISSLTHWLMPLLMAVIIIVGYFKGVSIYETLVDGAKEGFNIAVTILPFMIAIFVGIGMFRASGALDILNMILSPFTELIGMPPEALPMALIRPLSGSGAAGVMNEIVYRDPDSFVSFLVSTMQGSTETTFYVLAVYFGAANVVKIRHALVAALSADVAGMLAALFFCRLLY
jgi:spore maturation protein SpmA